MSTATKRYVEVTVEAGETISPVDRMFVEKLEASYDKWSVEGDTTAAADFLGDGYKLLKGIRYWMDVAWKEQQKRVEYEIDLEMMGRK